MLTSPEERDIRVAARENALSEIQYEIGLRRHTVDVNPDVGYGLPALQIVMWDMMQTSLNMVRKVSLQKRRQEEF